MHSEPELIVLKNNQPSAVILSPEEFSRLSEIEENYKLLTEAARRLEANEQSTYIPESDVLKHFGITESRLKGRWRVWNSPWS